MKRCAVLDDYANVALTLADWRPLEGRVAITVFNDHMRDEDAVAARLKDFDIVCPMRERTPFPRSLIEKLPNLQLIVTTGMRNAAIDVAAAAERGITVCGTASRGNPTPELAWGLIIGLLRHIPREAQAMRDGGWQTTVGRELYGKTLGIVGLGRIGTKIAAVAKAFEMDVAAWSPNLTPEHCAAAGVRHLDRQALFRSADIVTIHLALSGRTRGIVGAAELAAMKPDAVLVNTARGPIVDEAALVAALRDRRIAGAALDVYDDEPLPADHALRRLDNVLLTPHLGYVSEENYRGMYAMTVEDIAAWLDGAPVRVIEP